MITQQLIEYVRQRVSAGVAREDITMILLDIGWSESDLDAVFSTPEVTAQKSTTQRAPKAEVWQRDTTTEVPLEIKSPQISKSPQVSKSFIPPSSRVQHPSKDSIWYRPAIIIVVLFILFGVVVGGAYAYYTYTKQPSAISVLRSVIENKVPVESVGFYATSTAITATNMASTSMNIASSSLGAQILGLRGNAKYIYATSTLAQNGTILFGKPGTHVDFNILMALQGSLSVATTSGTYFVGLHTILSSKALDVKLLHANVSIKSSSPKLRMQTAFVNTVLAKMLYRWVRFIDFTQATSSPQLARMSLDSLASSSPAVAKDLKELRAYAYGFQYVRSARNVGTEYVQGIPTYHLSLVIQNTPASILLMQRLAYEYVQSSRIGGAIQNMSFANFLQKTTIFNKTFSQNIPVDIWVGKNNSRIYKVTIPKLNVVLPNNNSMTLHEVIGFTNYNTILKIVPPQNPEPIQSFVSGIFRFSPGSGM